MRSPKQWRPIEWIAIAAMLVLLFAGIVLHSVIPYIPASLIGVWLAQYRKKNGLIKPKKREYQDYSN